MGDGRDPTVAARFLLDKLLLDRCLQQQCPWSMTRRSSSTVVDVPVIMRDSGSAPDSVHRGYGGHSSSQQRQVLDLAVAAMMGLFDAFCVIFRAPPVIPELSASFSSFRVQRVCQFMNCGDVDIHTLIASSEQQQQQQQGVLTQL